MPIILKIIYVNKIIISTFNTTLTNQMNKLAVIFLNYSNVKTLIIFILS